MSPVRTQALFTHDPVNDYVKICTKSLNAQEFGLILAKRVTLSHKTNGVLDGTGEGREQVVEHFEKYIFSNTSNIDTPEVTITPVNGNKMQLYLNLKVEETKTEKVMGEDGKEIEANNRYQFNEITVFTLKLKDPTKKNPFTKEPIRYLIKAIDSAVTRTPVKVQRRSI